jgi:uncharacterized protein with PQ loop repeat
MNFCSWAKTVYPFSSTAIWYWSLYGIPTASNKSLVTYHNRPLKLKSWTTPALLLL